MSEPNETLDSCGCCEGLAPAKEPDNRPGLDALDYRIGTHGSFLERMLRALPRAKVAAGDDGQAQSRPLASLTSRDPAEPAVALLDACATVADVLTFYQERIANEGFLRTATERRSVLELARAIGYELSPGVAAHVYLAFSVEDAAGAPGVCAIDQGMQVQSVPPQDKLPQIFETSTPFTARAEWNTLRPRLTRPAEIAIVVDGTDLLLCLLGLDGEFAESADALTASDYYPLGKLDDVSTQRKALKINSLFVNESATIPAKGDLLLFAGRKANSVKTVLRRIAGVTPDPERKRVRLDLRELTGSLPEARTTISYTPPKFAAFGKVTLRNLGFGTETLRQAIGTGTWRERDLRVLSSVQGWRLPFVAKALATAVPAERREVDTGLFSFRERLAFFGHNAPRRGSLPKAESLKNDPYTGPDWDAVTTGTPRTIWEDSQGTANPNAGPHAYLERYAPGLAADSWAVFESPDQTPQPYRVFGAAESSRADYGLSGKGCGLTLGDASGNKCTTIPTTPAFGFRTTVAHVVSQPLDLAPLPIEQPVASGATSIELGQLAFGLSAGQPIILSGELEDTRGVEASEVVFIDEVVHNRGFTTLLLKAGVKQSYVRDKLVINANVVHATHGETVQELLGGGNGAVSNQRFLLRKPPLTYVPAGNTRGSETTLELRVNGVRWDEAPSLYGLGAHEEKYTVRHDDDGRSQVIFGDGIRGARLPSGAANVTARYRSGIGPDGEVDADSLTILRTRPLGLRGVTNPLEAGGAEGPERLANARRNAPQTVLTFERVVSLEDFEDFARTFPGIGKAQAELLWQGDHRVVALTVAGANGKAPPDDTLDNLRQAIRAGSDGSQAFVVQPFKLRYFNCRASIWIDARYQPDRVLAALDEALRHAYSFEARELAQSVFEGEVMSLMQGVDGVTAVDVDALEPYVETEEESSGAATLSVPARRAFLDAATGIIEPAELWLINPAGIALEART
jgi:hypothetical protein